MDKEDLLLQKRIQELAERSYGQGVYTFTDFLSLPQLDLCLSMENQLRYAGMTLFGGTAECDRKIIRFGNAEGLGYEEPFPIACLAIEPLAEKFAIELTHRDYLGALMNLGIQRENLGDIFVQGKKAWLFCLERIAPFIRKELTQVGRNPVKISQVEVPKQLLHREKKEVNILASSARLDGIIAKQYHFSRSQSLELFRSKKIYVNGRLCESSSYPLKEGDTVSIRGFGKFQFEGIAYETKKGKFSYRIGVYQ
ncbi:MAG: RNA-binding protein [Lachnospiraceae bacterium]